LEKFAGFEDKKYNIVFAGGEQGVRTIPRFDLTLRLPSTRVRTPCARTHEQQQLA
jgi:hypothetical protein